MSVKDVLKNWTLMFVKNRDIIHNLIKNIDSSNKDFDFIVHRKDDSLFYLMIPELSDINVITNKAENKRLNVVILNSRKNINFIINNWNSLIKFPDLCFYFVNPNSKNEQKWILFPRNHDLIIETKNLKKSLLVLFSSVPDYRGF